MTLYNADGQINTTQVAGNAYTGLHAADGSINIVINASSSYVGLYHTCGAFNAFVTTNPSAGFYAANGSMNVISAGSGYVSVVPAGNGSYTSSGPTAPVLSMDASWDSSQASPIFDIDAAFADQDDLQFETEVLGAGWASPTVVHHTVTTAEITGSQISLGLGAFPNGNWEARCKFKHSGGLYSSYSNTQTFTISSTSYTPTYYILGF